MSGRGFVEAKEKDAKDSVDHLTAFVQNVGTRHPM
jgi:hypothetical protein